MLTPQNNATYTRLAVLTAIARSYLQYNFANIDDLPALILPDNVPSRRGSLGRDRLIIKLQCMAAMGYTSAFIPVNTELSKLVAETLARKTPHKATVAVIREACEACERSYEISNRCRYCSERYCAVNCPQNAVTFYEHAHIKQNFCKKCGICYSDCPYSAINKTIVPCEDVCAVNALSKEHSGQEYIDQNKCTACGQCLIACPHEAIVYNSQIIDVLKALKNPHKRKIAALTPKIVDKFGDWNMTVAAFKRLGFDEIVQGIPDIDAAEKTQRKYHIVLIGSYLAERTAAETNPEIDNALIFEEALALFSATNLKNVITKNEKLMIASATSKQYPLFLEDNTDNQ